MSRGNSGTLPLRLWLALALVAIVGVPTLTTWTLSTALAERPAAGDLATIATVQGILGNAPSLWHDPSWQHQARQRLSRLNVDVLLYDATGKQVFATPNVPSLLQWWTAGVGRLAFSVSRQTNGLTVAHRTPLLPRMLTTLPVFAIQPSSSTPVVPTQGTSTSRQAAALPQRQRHVRVNAPGLVGVASVWLVPADSPPRPPLWLVPVAGLVALLVTLTVVAWWLGRLVLRPLAAMSLAADHIAGGNLDVHLPPTRAREVAEVGAALIGMSAALRDALQRQAALEEERRLFVGAIAHDLHTPLFVLRGYLQGLENGVATKPEKVAAYIAECRSKVDALGRLIADLFAYARVEYLEQVPQQEPLDLTDLLRHIVAGLQPLAAEKNIKLTPDGPTGPCPLMGHPHLLTRAVENLVNNALRHTMAGGTICVRWGIDGHQYVIHVEDTGPGIAAQDLPHLFTPLYRGESSRNRQTGGAGLGLTIARRILQAHDGDLIAANRATGGAVFTTTLPVGQYTSASRDIPNVRAP